jgi:hypothetical protein
MISAQTQSSQQVGTMHSRKDVIEITRRLHKIKRRLLLNIAIKNEEAARANGQESRYAKSTCACNDDDNNTLSVGLSHVPCRD